MPFQVETSAIGIGHLSKALEGLRDERGQRWKRHAFLRAGAEAIKPTVRKAKSNTPFKSGNTRKYLDATKGRYNSKPKLNKKGFATRPSENEYRITTTIAKGFSADPTVQKDRKGRAYQYPFMNEVGVPPQKYERVTNKGVLQIVNRKAPRNQMAYMHRALGSTYKKVVDVFVERVDFYVQLYAKSTYKTLRGAVNSFERTGGVGRKWK